MRGYATMIKVLFICHGTPVLWECIPSQTGAEYGIIWQKVLELLRFRLLRLMVESGIKAKVLGGFLSSKRLLAGNVVEIVTMKMRKK